ncbi:JmjC domain-containing protein [Polaromonas naphthalenivorans]|uniref:Cupin 4 family protein n=1 Tax=Polaromonas naphthalenivorans (strain CJ2) TaxID=365044 RepID=A1VLH8_POLNA|nr:cupin domain-containing protein [Polaromonas naphthalenivorans]ABM36506.1 Cupin 4 family protein [Polaromonas naphthalenivorans CJ2]
MDVNQPLPLLAGLTPAQFMRRHWQKKPLLVRQAIAGFEPFLSRAALFKLAAREQVESRLIVQQAKGWGMKKGPFASKSLPPLSQEGWTLLVQGVDLHEPAGHALLQQFRFVPDARLDDLMISFATPGGGVGPHFDSYDVFLFQASGRRRWKIGLQKDFTLQPDVPLKILQNFEVDEEFVLEAGDMLYLPPRYAHDGIAEASVGTNGKPADCMTYSIGFRSPARTELASELLHRLAEMGEDAAEEACAAEAGRKPARAQPMYRDPTQPATETPAAMPAGLADFAGQAVLEALKDPLALACALGEYMTEPKPGVWFDEPEQAWDGDAAKAGQMAIALDARTRMMYDSDHIFINGESYRAKGADASLMHRLANQRCLLASELRKAGASAIELLGDWHEAGWVQQIGQQASGDANRP